MKAINRTKVFKKYKGLWVAFKQDQVTVVGSGKTLKEAEKEAVKSGYSRPIFSFMHPNLDKTLIGGIGGIFI